MSLQFIFGNSGSGKSTYLYQKIIEESMQRPDGNFIVIVPEQFTMQTQNAAQGGDPGAGEAEGARKQDEPTGLRLGGEISTLGADAVRGVRF